MELTLLMTLLNAITSFLDEEEKLGFLEQDVIDKLMSIEAMLDEVIFGITYKKDEPAPAQLKELMYVPFLDVLDEEYTHKVHHELEL